MDFFNVVHSLFNGPYSYGSIYPPLPLLLYKLLLRFVPYDIVEKGVTAIRASQTGQIVLLSYMLITLLVFLILLMEVKKGLKIEKYIFGFVILFSGPFIFQFERANTIFVSLLFLIIFVFFKDSKNQILREFALISLAISGAIKFYPALFGLLLIKDRRYKDFFKVFIYGFALFILPFFALGGISQLPILVKNVFSTSDIATKWGVGYSVNIQNIVRILFGFFGDFGNGPIFIGRIFSFVILFLGIISFFFLRSKWKTMALLTLLMIMVPAISYVYTLIFMVIPLIMFLDSEEKEKFDYLYLACFILIFIPFTLGKVDIINNGLGRNPNLPLTYGVLIQNIAISIMAFCLIIQGFMAEKPKRALLILKAYLLAIIIKIYGTRYAGMKGRLLIVGKILLTLLIAVIIFGDGMFSAVYSHFKITNSAYSKTDTSKRQDNPHIFSIEPYYVHYADKVVVKGENFNWWLNKHAKFMSNFGEIDPSFWSDTEFTFTVPLNWQVGKVIIWVETPPIPTYEEDNLYHIGNKVEINILDRSGGFNYDDIKYFAQIKYLDEETRRLNNFKNFKLSGNGLIRRIPTKFFQTYADLIELKDKLL